MDIPLPQTWEEAAPQLLPVLRRVTEPAHAWQAEQSDPDNRLIRRPVVPLLSGMVVLDLPDLRMYVNQGHLRLWGVDEDAVYAAALGNLEPHAVTGLTHRREWGLWQLASEDGYEASRLLLPGWLAAFDHQTSGRPVCAVPGSRVVLIGDEADGGQMATLMDIALRGFRSAAAPLSPVLYKVGVDQVVVPWQPDPEDPLWSESRDAARLMAAYEYAEQTAQLLDDDTLEPYVCAVALQQTEQGARTQASWDRREGPALLPVVDRLVLRDGEVEITTTFQALQHHAGGCLEATPLAPARWLARWPMPGTLEKLRGLGGTWDLRAGKFRVKPKYKEWLEPHESLRWALSPQGEDLRRVTVVEMPNSKMLVSEEEPMMLERAPQMLQIPQ